jgi:hypothetical protein
VWAIIGGFSTGMLSFPTLNHPLPPVESAYDIILREVSRVDISQTGIATEKKKVADQSKSFYG